MQNNSHTDRKPPHKLATTYYFSFVILQHLLNIAMGDKDPLIGADGASHPHFKELCFPGQSNTAKYTIVCVVVYLS